MTPPARIDRDIRELRNTLAAAERNFEIWWVYKSRETRPKYIDSMNRYLGFFSVSIHAHFLATVIALYRIFEGRRDTVNLNRTFKSLPATSKSKLPDDLNIKLARGSELGKKVAIVRNNCLAHLNVETETENFFGKAGLTHDSIKELIEISKELVNDISQAWDGSVYAFNLDAKSDTVSLLDDLNRLALKP